MNKISIFHISLIGGLLFILVAFFLIHNDPGIKWYLIGMGQIMMGVGLVGTVLGRKVGRLISATWGWLKDNQPFSLHIDVTIGDGC